MSNKARYLIIFIAVVALWNTIFVKPLKLFSVFLHELGHALMSFVFGQGLQGLNINVNEGGYALVLPKGWFSAFMIANGGYLGSLFFALLIILLKRTRVKKFILGTAALILLAVAVKFSGLSFTLLYSAIFVACVVIVYMVQKDMLYDWVVDILGIAGITYAVYDAFVDTILLQINFRFHLIGGWYASQPKTDAVQLAGMTGIPAIVWGIIWLVIMALAINAFILKGKGGSRRSGARG